MSDIRKGSKGKDYPWTVVGTIVQGRTIYYVMNLETGVRDDTPYGTSKGAHAACTLIAAGLLEVIEYEGEV